MGFLPEMPWALFGDFASSSIEWDDTITSLAWLRIGRGHCEWRELTQDPTTCSILAPILMIIPYNRYDPPLFTEKEPEGWSTKSSQIAHQSSCSFHHVWLPTYCCPCIQHVVLLCFDLISRPQVTQGKTEMKPAEPLPSSCKYPGGPGRKGLSL